MLTKIVMTTASEGSEANQVSLGAGEKTAELGDGHLGVGDRTADHRGRDDVIGEGLSPTLTVPAARRPGWWG
ncbi:hypothetical protein OIB37_00995 [Streptomyces sp. NBC_00820]|uniref:hypothetical protein n=1 Tax=Streptomyces sp. NBC_00820 TaxID=2975842 RepID=UPI002ED22B4E|nr:hypothetical protein OIB37_00995 [Streptomyces sp. NBC_00820]